MQEINSPSFAGNKFHVDYNNRLQPTEIWAGGAQGTAALFDKQYQYNPAGMTQLNNGNIYSVTNLKDDTRTQFFTYDSLDRLISAGDKTHWSNTYVYDPWGNLLQKNPGAPAGENLVNTADDGNHLSGMTYDAAGNVINDGLGGAFVYDAESRITTAAGVTYTYNADGRRIKKSTGTNYWYGPGGNVLAETDSSGAWTNYIFFGGRRLARNVPQPSPNPADIKYYITDHLHSTAMFVDKAGTTAAILDDNDFYPWGGVVPGVGKTTSNNTVKFTGQYRDTESNLDYFGARYYANVTGRFMSPDWASNPTSVPYAEFGDPQSLNLYSYVRNSPIVRVDADGHDLWGTQGTSVAPNIEPVANCIPPWCISGDNLPGAGGDGGSGTSQQRSQTQQPQQAQQPLGSLTVLGQKVTLTYSTSLTDTQKTEASNKLSQSAASINTKADKLSEAQKAAIAQIHTIEVVQANEKSLGQNGNGFVISVSYLRDTSTAWVGSLFAHESQHRLNAGKFKGADLWRDEQSASNMQLGVGIILGFTPHEIKSLSEWAADSNQKAMQEHMEKGFKY